MTVAGQSSGAGSGKVLNLPPGPVPDLEERMFNGLDKAALIMLDTLENEKKGPDGEYTTSLKIRMDVFTMAQAWMAKRVKMRPIDTSSDSGIKLLQELMSDPENVVERLHDDPEFQKALKARGWLAPLPKKNGRPTAAEAKVRDDYTKRKSDHKQVVRQADDSGLQKLLGSKEED